MTALDVISLETAKNYLKVDFNDDDSLIEDIIKSAVNIVEQRTQYRLFERQEIFNSDATYDLDILATPIKTISVQDINGKAYGNCQIRRDPVRTKVIFNSGYDYSCLTFASSVPLFNILCTVGFADISNAPYGLLQAVKNLVVYMYDNRDLAGMDIPSNISTQLDTLNRAPLW